jgi:di/tricarboxylate transporter
VLDLHDIAGLTSLEHAHVISAEGAGTAMFEAVVAPSSRLVGSDLRSADFRRRYGGAVLAIHRADEALAGQLGRIPLRAGDVLLVLAPASFAATWRRDIDFSLVASLTEPPPARRQRSWLVLAAAIGMIVATVTGVVSLFEAAVAAAIVVVAGGVIDAREGFRSVNLHVVATMALAISLGRIVTASGLAGDIASAIERVDGAGRYGTVAIILVATVLLTELLTNAAAAALMVPIAVSLANGIGVDPKMLAVAVLIGASCSFLTPIGYQTNMMVWSLGGYRFTDFARAGAPLTLVTIVTATIAIPLAFG